MQTSFRDGDIHSFAHVMPACRPPGLVVIEAPPNVLGRAQCTPDRRSGVPVAKVRCRHGGYPE